jgi:hypothetical protein
MNRNTKAETHRERMITEAPSLYEIAKMIKKHYRYTHPMFHPPYVKYVTDVLLRIGTK